MGNTIVALASCLLPLLIMGIIVIILSWKNRGKIECIEISAQSFKILFGKSGRQR